jgi:outer membrane protein OmpA-like peptidoglycan-associated protein
VLPLPAQLKVTRDKTPEQLIREVLIGPGVKVSNVKFKGNPAGIAGFKNDNLPVGIGAGMILSTGQPEGAAGANTKPDYSEDIHGEGDNILARIANGKTYDATIIEFDFIPENDNVYFNYIFASDEYPEYVGTQYNDVFAFHISGPGINGSVNIARLPGTGKPVTVNTVNHILNAAWYVDNNPFDRMNHYQEKKAEKLNAVLLSNMQYDGFTAVLTAHAPVRPGETYHIRLAIADVSDAGFDSSVFLQASSFISAPDLATFLTLMPTVSTDIRPRLMAVEVAGNDTAASRIVSPATPAVKPEVTPVTAIPADAVTLHFSFDDEAVKAEDQKALEKVVSKWKSIKGSLIHVVGHTDESGPDTYNNALSRRRANATRDVLVGLGVQADKIIVEWEGENDPVKPGSSGQADALNRRVEVFVMLPK